VPPASEAILTACLLVRQATKSGFNGASLSREVPSDGVFNPLEEGMIDPAKVKPAGRRIT
jgi:hypothetical protein